MDDHLAQKKIAVFQTEVEIVPDVDAACSAMDTDKPCTTAATGRRQVWKAGSKGEHGAELLFVWDGIYGHPQYIS